MKITLESTPKIVKFEGIDARIWHGRTEDGIACYAYIPRVVVATAADRREFDRDLLRRPAPAGLEMFVIYEHPTDHAEDFVVRKWIGNEPREIVGKAFTLQGARRLVPAGAHCVPRFAGDDPVIAETWLA